MTLNRAKTVIQHEPQDGLPTIIQPVAVVIAVCFVVIYVAPFYLSKALRISESVSRNSPESIQARCQAVFLTCCLCTIITINVQSVVGVATPAEMLHRAGIYPVILTDVVRTMTLVAILFAGPLYEAGIVEGGWRHWFRWSVIREEMYDDWIGWRNLVVGPASEELIFRSLTVSLLLCAWTPPGKIVWEAPLLFGIAHLHHLNEFVITHKRPGQSYFSAMKTPAIIVPGILRAVFQLAFTSVFGMFVTFVYLRTGNLYSCILAHTFCNWMGFPRLWGRLGGSAEEVYMHPSHDERLKSQELDELDASGSKANVARRSETAQGAAVPRGGGLGVQWTVVYYLLLGAGIVGFAKLLYPLTESDNQLVWL
ncbi:hypothetical protein CAC42_1316 [Sphaceloma murrayae]|uniref:intramembrane prenyl-peptidase Rce1 n=1 Tax=Sphaceloma murrayae TaxID=2082308 RepID=A0A2K1QFI1_9PEZI|nr:hypothetical protein CAC42_1316 [Sphaceloma murrayae]